MFTQTDRLRRRRDAGEAGFTLVEVIVALSVFAVVAVAALPLLMVGLKAAGKTRVETLAKDLSQLRIERMRNLPFHVDRQNGPFIDLLDRYYTNVSGTSTATGEPSCSGQYLASAPGTGGAPSGAAYRVTCTQLPEALDFSQAIYMQFLVRTGVPATIPATYDTQTDGQDVAPSQLVGVTVLTSWNRGGNSGTLRTYTEIADSRDNAPLVTTQAQAVALKVSSNSDSLGTLVATAGQVKADGSLTSGSVANVQTVGASLEQSGAGPVSSSVLGAVAPKVTAPANPAGDTSSGSDDELALGGLATSDWTKCGWGWTTKSGYSNVSSTTGAGLPWAPSNVTNNALLDTSPRTEAGLQRSGNGCAAGHATSVTKTYGFGFRNWLTAPLYSPLLDISTQDPLVWIPDSSGGGSVGNGLVTGSAAVSATDALTATHDATAVARARTNTVYVLPTVGYPDGLVQVTLTKASISCKSGTTASAAYDLTVAYPGGSKTINFVTGGAVVPSLPEPSSIAVGSRTLADYLSWSVSAGPSAQDQNNGASSIDSIFSLTVPESVVGNGGFGLQLGALSCLASDSR